MASLTHQVAVMQYPSLTRSTVRHIELVPIGPQRLLVVLIAGTGRVEQRVLETSTPAGRRACSARSGPGSTPSRPAAS